MVTGVFANRHIFGLGLAFIVARAIKILYDILMLAMFLGYRTVDERTEENIGSEAEREQGPVDEVTPSSTVVPSSEGGHSSMAAPQRKGQQLPYTTTAELNPLKDAGLRLRLPTMVTVRSR